MNEQIHTVLAKMRFLIAPIYVLVALLFVSIPISMLDPIRIQPATAASARAGVSDSPNLVTSGVLAGGEVLKATGRSIGVVASEVANSLIHTSQVFVHGAYV